MMLELLILRHGPTEWNKDKRLQGRSDIALSAEGRKEVGCWRIPTPFTDFNWISSPLSRAQDTASILGHT
ncbi:MAG: histidine phosphatase family protein, partial [Rhodospirillales bacterium]